MSFPTLTTREADFLTTTGRVETLYVPIMEGISARVEIQVIQEPAIPAPSERQTRRAPTARELHTIADALARRIYQFHPID